jgi:beta-N-acetylhexosaminidase
MDLSKKPFYLSKKEIDEVNNELNSLTIEEKVHQMFCVLGDCYTKDELINLVKAGIGGVLFRPIKTMKEINSEFIE